MFTSAWVLLKGKLVELFLDIVLFRSVLHVPGRSARSAAQDAKKRQEKAERGRGHAAIILSSNLSTLRILLNSE